MILRWTVAAVPDAATRFRHVADARPGLLKLVVALRALDAGQRGLEPSAKLA
jgi:hypothetical protein